MLLTVNIEEIQNVYKYFLTHKISFFNFGLLFLSVKVRQGIRRSWKVLPGFRYRD